MNIGEKLFELRKEKNLSQEEIAGKLNVTRQTVSKWETNQSVPDFDKIIPLCELFEITAEELLIEKKDNNKKMMSKEQVKKKSAEIISRSVLIYILAIAFLIMAIPVFKINPIVAVAVFLCIIAWPTYKLIKHFMSIPKFQKTQKEKEQEKVIKQIENISLSVCIFIYFLISYLTHMWEKTWIIFVINTIICKFIRLRFMLKETNKK